MSIAYSVNSKINPIQLDAPGRYYATAKSSGDVTLKQLGKEIAQRSTGCFMSRQSKRPGLPGLFAWCGSRRRGAISAARSAVSPAHRHVG